MSSRGKTAKGTFTQKRGDTKMKTIEKKYGVDFNVRGDMKLENYLKRENLGSLTQALTEKRKK